jgi:hypothetical protein
MTATPDSTDIYRQLEEYNWDKDAEFQVCNLLFRPLEISPLGLALACDSIAVDSWEIFASFFHTSS